MSDERPMVTVVVPCRNERAHIVRCLDTVLATTYPLDRLEVLVVDGGSDDGTRELVADYAARHPRVKLLDNPRRIVPTALNLAIQQAAGEVIIRMDAHSEYPPEYIPGLVDWLLRSGADNVGGAWVTRPGDGSPMARAIAAALAHPLGIGNARYRLGTDGPREVDTVPFGCFRREIFDRIGLFDEELVRNQDDELNHRLVRRGGRILLVPGIVSYYYARRTWRQLARTFFQYGYFKPLAIRKAGGVVTLRPLAPAALAAVLCVGALLFPWLRIARVVMLGTLAGYTIAVVGAAVTQVRRLGASAAARLPLAFVALHFGYGLGFLLGAVRLALPGRAWAPERFPLSR